MDDGTIFSMLDASIGHWEVEIAEWDLDMKTFIYHYGLFRFTRIKFGLQGAPGTFQHAMDVSLTKVNWQFVLVY